MGIKTKRRRLKQLAITLVTLSLILAACNRPGNSETTNNESSETSETVAVEAPTQVTRTVRVIEAKSTVLNATRNATVTIEPRQESRVAAGTNGRIEGILKREGETVTKGEAVIQLDDNNLQSQVQNASLALESARINLQRAQRSSTETTDQLGVSLRSVQTSFDLSKRQFEEGEALFAAGGIAQNDLSALEAQFVQAEANLAQVQDSLARSQRAGTEDLALLEVQISQAQTQLSQAQDALAEAKITAPFDGEIAEVLVEEGEFIGAGNPAFRLVSTGSQLGQFSVPPQDAQSLLSQGVIFFRYQGLDYAAAVVRSSAAPGSQRLVDITAEIYESELPIPSGSVAVLNYNVDLAEGIKVPTSSLFIEKGENFVYVVNEDKSLKQQVSIVAEVSGEAVVEGLTEGQLVISPVPADLRDNSQVRILGQ